jgi:hypothetical protein
MGEAFESPPGTADDGARRPADGIHKPLALALAIGTCQVTVEDQGGRTESFTVSKVFDGAGETRVHGSRWRPAPQQRKRKLNGDFILLFKFKLFIF